LLVEVAVVMGLALARGAVVLVGLEQAHHFQ
jgi:hypothetical protein